MLTLIGFIITALSYVTVDQVASWLPTEYKILAPTIIGIIGYAAAQFSEEKRVIAAEQLKTENLLLILEFKEIFIYFSPFFLKMKRMTSCIPKIFWCY